VEVSAEDGVVTLQGDAPNSAVRRILLDLAEDTSGVDAVVDALNESPERFVGTPAAGSFRQA
jgi:osmotically-inducible protein OsmY